MWAIERTKTVADWVKELDDDAKEAIVTSLRILREIGPSLGRPLLMSLMIANTKI